MDFLIIFSSKTKINIIFDKITNLVKVNLIILIKIEKIFNYFFIFVNIIIILIKNIIIYIYFYIIKYIKKNYF
jgi:hypothetical protein